MTVQARALLLKFGTHLRNCDHYKGITYECSCGYSAALAGREPAPETQEMETCNFRRPVRPAACPVMFPTEEQHWCGACLVEKYDPETHARHIEAVRRLHVPLAPRETSSQQDAAAIWSSFTYKDLYALGDVFSEYVDKADQPAWKETQAKFYALGKLAARAESVRETPSPRPQEPKL